MLLSHGSKVASNGDLLARNNLLTRSLGFHMLIIGKKNYSFFKFIKVLCSNVAQAVYKVLGIFSSRSSCDKKKLC